jgi:hypothetical protein
MGSSKKKHHKPEPEEAGWRWLTQAGLWAKKIANLRILRVALWTWLSTFVTILVVFGPIVLIIYKSSGPATSETFVAKVNDMQVEDYTSARGGSHTVYRIWLKQNDKEFPCMMGPVMVRLWDQLEIGKSYEFTITQNPSVCYVNTVTTIDEPHPFGIEE